jgi:hypothetical protein
MSMGNIAGPLPVLKWAPREDAFVLKFEICFIAVCVRQRISVERPAELRAPTTGIGAGDYFSFPAMRM